MRFDITGGSLKGLNAGFNLFTGESDGSVIGLKVLMAHLENPAIGTGWEYFM